MSQNTQPQELSTKKVVYHMPGMDAVTARRDIEYRAAGTDALTMDIYYPSNDKRNGLLPVVVFVAGYPDPGLQAALGCRFKEMGSSVSWAQLVAASGLAAVTYTNTKPDKDIHALLQFLIENGELLGIDSNRVGLWASSGNVPTALSVFMHEQSKRLKCAVLCYGFMLDAIGSKTVAKAAEQWGFANPCEGVSVGDFPQDIPLLIARAGGDSFAHLNASIDHFVAAGLKRNLPLTFVNHAEGPHAFDLFDDSSTTRGIIRQILAFIQFKLLE